MGEKEKKKKLKHHRVVNHRVKSLSQLKEASWKGSQLGDLKLHFDERYLFLKCKI